MSLNKGSEYQFFRQRLKNLAEMQYESINLYREN